MIIVIDTWVSLRWMFHCCAVSLIYVSVNLVRLSQTLLCGSLELTHPGLPVIQYTPLTDFWFSQLFDCPHSVVVIAFTDLHLQFLSVLNSHLVPEKNLHTKKTKTFEVYVKELFEQI